MRLLLFLGLFFLMPFSVHGQTPTEDPIFGVMQCETDRSLVVRYTYAFIDEEAALFAYTHVDFVELLSTEFDKEGVTFDVEEQLPLDIPEDSAVYTGILTLNGFSLPATLVTIHHERDILVYLFLNLPTAQEILEENIVPEWEDYSCQYEGDYQPVSTPTIDPRNIL